MVGTRIGGSRELLRLDCVCKRFGGLKALDELSFGVAAGETVGLIGPNGSGKSTAFDIICGLIPATSGDILFEGESIARMPAHQAASLGIARTFQNVRPFMKLTALENVVVGSMFGRAALRDRIVAEQRALTTLATVGLRGKARTLAQDLATTEQKWLELARAIAGQPKLLLLDEFVAGFHTEDVARAIEIMRQLNANGMTIIMVEHIVKIVNLVCERVIVLSAGKKLADAAAAEVIQMPRVREVYLGKSNA